MTLREMREQLGGLRVELRFTTVRVDEDVGIDGDHSGGSSLCP